MRKIDHIHVNGGDVVFQEHLKPRTSKTLKQSPLSNVAFVSTRATHRLLWLSPSATQMSLTRFDLTFFCLWSLIWQPCCQAQACGALAEWLRHQPEYTNLAPNAIENFNLASSFMSKVNMDILLEWELQNIKGAPREDDQCVHSCRQAKSRRGGWSRCPGFN